MLFILFLFISISLSQGYVQYNNQLSTELSRLWDLDVNRCEPGVDYELELQGYVTNLVWTGRDRAPTKLFKFFNESKIFDKPTYKAFKDLLDNYNADTSLQESYTAAEEAETNTFLGLIVQTDVIKEVYRLLVQKGKFVGDMNAFKQTLHDLWFKLYKRLRTDNRINSCGFEHVFVGEKKNRDVTGFHNWIQLYLQEKQGSLDYRGYFRRGTTEELETHPRLLTFQFSLNYSSGKGLTSIFVGTSPEFEIGLNTLVHLMRFQTPPSVHIKNYPLQVVTRGHNNNIGSAYPVSLSS